MMKSDTFPPKIQIELCNICNGGCTICPIPKMERKRQIMDFELFKKIIKELKENNFKGEIYPFLHGESLLIPNITKYLEYIKENVPDSKVILYTNGSRLTNKLNEEIIKNKLIDQLVLSFDGNDKESFESIRTNLSFENVTENFKDFLILKDTLKMENPEVKINTVVTKETRENINELKGIFPLIDINYSVNYNYAGQLDGNIINSHKRDSKWNVLTKCNSCFRLYEYIHILVNGDVCLCCYDYEGKEILGNINKSSIQDIWLGEEFNKKRNYLKNRKFSKLPLCNNCNFIDRNLFMQQLVKIKPKIENNFPNFSKYIVRLYAKMK